VSDDDFTKCWQYQQALRMQPAQDQIYRRVWHKDVVIERVAREDDDPANVLDRQFHIDTRVQLPGGGCFTLQEKALSHSLIHWNTFTVEYHQDRRDPTVPGEFFHLAAQFYLSGYLDETGEDYEFWNIIKWPEFLTWHKELYGDNPPLHDNKSSWADFIYPKLDLMPIHLFHCRSVDFDTIPELLETGRQMDFSEIDRRIEEGSA